MNKHSGNQGEGNRSADKAYREDTRNFVESGKVDENAQKAKNALEGSEREELEKAEREGKKPLRK